MTLPPRVSEAFLRFGVAADTLVFVDDLYRHLGPGVVEAVSELLKTRGLRPDELRPAHLEEVRPRLGERFLREHHASWLAGRSTPGFWRDRSLAGTATGVAIPLGDLETPPSTLSSRIAAAARAAAGETQPEPRGLLMLSQNSHRNSQPDVFAFDLVPSRLEEALAVNATTGRHHTLPGSIGETSGRALSDPALAIVWETQPNMFKPSGERNRGANAAYRRHRTWPLLTTIASFAWLREREYRVFVLRGAFLRATHEADPGQPVIAETERLHDVTMKRAAGALGLCLAEVERLDLPKDPLRLAKVNLGQAIEEQGFQAVAWELR
jgi:hypothetical protein